MQWFINKQMHRRKVAPVKNKVQSHVTPKNLIHSDMSPTYLQVKTTTINGSTFVSQVFLCVVTHPQADHAQRQTSSQ